MFERFSEAGVSRPLPFAERRTHVANKHHENHSVRPKRGACIVRCSNAIILLFAISLDQGSGTIMTRSTGRQPCKSE